MKANEGSRGHPTSSFKGRLQSTNCPRTMLAVATSFFARTAISQSYNIGNPSFSRPATPGSVVVSSNGPTPFTPSFVVGLWKVQPASHKANGKRVSVWCFDKRGPEMEKLSASARDRALEVLKAEVVSFSMAPCEPFTTNGMIGLGTRKTSTSFYTG